MARSHMKFLYSKRLLYLKAVTILLHLLPLTGGGDNCSASHTRARSAPRGPVR